MNKIMLWNREKDQKLVISALKEGKVVAGASDTVLGLLADTTSQGVSSLNEIKGRELKPYIILIESIDKAAYFANSDDLQKYGKLMKSCWPGPLTLILKAQKDLSGDLRGQDGTVALRVPKHQGLQAILGSFKGLFSTSANLSGKPIPLSLNELDPVIKEKIDLYILDEEQQTEPIKPSTIVDLTGETPKIIREGAIAKDRIQEILSQ